MDATAKFNPRWVRLLLPVIVCVVLAACGSSGGNGGARDGLREAIKLDTLDYDLEATIAPWVMLVQTAVQFRALGKDESGVAVDVSDLVIWQSSDLDIITISATGEATGVAPGSAKISAMLGSTSGKQVVSQTVTVTAANLAIGAAKDFIFVNDAVQMSDSVKLTNGSYFSTGGKELWSVSDGAVATINEKGMLIAHAAGDVTVSATFLNLKADYSLSVSEAFIVKASEIGNNQIVLDWTPVRGAESYTLTWKTPGYFGGFVSKAVTALTQTRYVHSGLENDSRYVYSVEAIPKYTYGPRDPSIFSNEIKLNTSSSNSAVLSGDVIVGVPETAITELRHALKVTIAKPSTDLRVGESYISRYSVNPINFDVIIPVTNMSENLSYCQVWLTGEKLREQSVPEVFSPLSVFSIMVGGVRDSGNGDLFPYCISPGRSGYMHGLVLVTNAATAADDFNRITELYADNWDSMFPYTTPAKAAIVPQSYVVIPPAPGSTNQRIEVTVKNVGTMAGVVTAFSKAILLDADNKPLDVIFLKPVATWDGLLDVSQTNTLFSDVYYTGKAQRIEVFVDFDLPPK